VERESGRASPSRLLLSLFRSLLLFPVLLLFLLPPLTPTRHLPAPVPPSARLPPEPAPQITIMGPADTLYEGGIFQARMVFPPEYPNLPPTVSFTSDVWHPNVYRDGRVCISILHPPGKDPHGYEAAGERWRPVHTVESILLSIVSLLSSPNDESPANLEAAKEWREDPEGFRKRVARCVRKSQEEL